MKTILKFVCELLYSLGHLAAYLFLEHGWFWLYKLHSWLNSVSYRIDKKFKLNVWK
jgi:hypothetical protein